jgi:thiol-disulfide isomerase/thioredoxin
MAQCLFADPPGKVATKTAAELEALVQGKESSPDELKAVADELEKSYGEARPPESVRMLIAIARGGQMGAGEGWFGPAQNRYSWDWLAKRHEIDAKDAIKAEAFRGPESLFKRLDRNRDGELKAEDFDWSDRNPWVQQSYMVNRLFRRFDQEGDGRVTREDMLAFFEFAAQGKDFLRSEDLRDALIGGMPGFAAGDAPSQPVLLRGLFRDELGSLQEGPQVEEIAPDFELKTLAGDRTIKLSEQFCSKPIVLVFGNFTCGPFRSMFPAVDDLSQRYRDEATFLGIYVREAHPTDGWHMESNAKVGVKVAQPKTYAQRIEVAQQCNAKLKYSMPLLVDEIHDPVGNAYSGMPARLYVIDSDGKVAYKSGRGPFGFKSGEMEQALLMLLLDRHSQAKP